MDGIFFRDFLDRYNKDKEELDRKFNDINTKLTNMDSRFDNFDEKMGEIDKRLCGIEEMQGMIFGKLGGFSDKLDNVKVYLTTIESKLNEYKMLSVQGQKVLDGELYTIKVKLQRIRPIISWENDELLENKYKEIEKSMFELEESIV